MRSHRRHHLPACIAIFQAWADTGRLIGQRRKVCELFMNALDALAKAEHGAWIAPSHDGPTAPAVSMTTIARKIQAGRAGLDQLARLAANAAEHETHENAEKVELLEGLLKKRLRTANEAPWSETVER